MKLLAWGTFDLGKPRLRLLLEGLRENGIEVDTCNVAVWSGIEDKSQVTGASRVLRIFWQVITAYPRLLFRFLRKDDFDAVLLGYPGLLDILVLWSFARIRRKPLILDAFISVYNTVVEDREMLSRINPLRGILFAIEWLALRAADIVVTDTRAHAEYFSDRYSVAPEKFIVAEVGAEAGFSTRAPREPRKGAAPVVLFYGQFIPLHGIDTIVRAAARAEGLVFRIIGVGQEHARMRKLAVDLGCETIQWVDWVDYEQLPDEIHAADVCLGIFGLTEKAARVIPNKVFQIVACGRPLVTADTPPVREFLAEAPHVRLVPAGDEAALVNAVTELLGSEASDPAAEIVNALAARTRPEYTARELAERLELIAR